jgi:hypothetical protein
VFAVGLPRRNKKGESKMRNARLTFFFCCVPLFLCKIRGREKRACDFGAAPMLSEDASFLATSASTLHFSPFLPLLPLLFVSF